MARLIRCKDCGQEVSKKAESCPSCGAPVKKKPRQFGCLSTSIVLVFVVFILVSVLEPSSNSPSPARSKPVTSSSSPPGETYWVTSDRLNRRTCPSTDCGIVGRLMFRERAGVLEVKSGWARITKYYQASCENGISRFVKSGNHSCTAENGIVNGKFAEWVAMDLLTRTRPADPAADAAGIEKLVSASDDYRVHKGVFVKTARSLINDNRCTAKDFLDNGGWVKSTQSANEPVYFIYCGGFTQANRLYLNAETGRIYR